MLIRNQFKEEYENRHEYEKESKKENLKGKLGCEKYENNQCGGKKRYGKFFSS